MSRAKPWTYEPFELSGEQTWVVYDENLAQIVAVFYDRKEALSYLKWRNKKQEKRKAEKRHTMMANFDDDGRC